MMLSAARAIGPQAQDHVGTNHPNETDEVARDLVAAPLLECLVDGERKAEVDRAGEVLLRPVEAVQRGELFGPQHAQRLEDLGADLVLAAIAPGGRRERRAKSQPAVQHHQQAVVLIIGMGGRVHENAGVAKVPERQAQRHVAPGRRRAGRRASAPAAPGTQDRPPARGRRRRPRRRKGVCMRQQTKLSEVTDPIMDPATCQRRLSDTPGRQPRDRCGS